MFSVLLLLCTLVGRPARTQAGEDKTAALYNIRVIPSVREGLDECVPSGVAEILPMSAYSDTSFMRVLVQGSTAVCRTAGVTRALML